MSSADAVLVGDDEYRCRLCKGTDDQGPVRTDPFGVVLDREGQTLDMEWVWMTEPLGVGSVGSTRAVELSAQFPKAVSMLFLIRNYSFN